MLFTDEQQESLLEYLDTIPEKAFIHIWANIVYSARTHPELVARCAWNELASIQLGDEVIH